MKKNKKNWRRTIKNGFIVRLIVILACVVAAVLVVRWAVVQLRSLAAGPVVEDRSTVFFSASQVKSIRDIGQWELLCINDEEYVDTVRHRLLGDDHLVRIYYGTLRLGLDLSDLDSTAVAVNGDSLVLTLPDVGLLDGDFIDEARTRSFHERGKWPPRAYNELYERARHKMMARTLTKANLDYTRTLAEEQVRRLLAVMGYTDVTIVFNQHPLPLKHSASGKNK